MGVIADSLNLFWRLAVKGIKDKQDNESVVTSRILLTSGWVKDDSDTTGYPYHYDLDVSGVTVNTIANVVVDNASQRTANSCGLLGVNQTLTGVIRFFARSVPATNINVSYWLKNITTGG